MSIPAPAILAITLLLGWPIVQIVTILVWGRSLSKTVRVAALRSWNSIRLSRAKAAEKNAEQIEGVPVTVWARSFAVHAAGHVLGILVVVSVLLLSSQTMMAFSDDTSTFARFLVIALYAALAVWAIVHDLRAAKQKRGGRRRPHDS